MKRREIWPEILDEPKLERCKRERCGGLLKTTQVVNIGGSLRMVYRECVACGMVHKYMRDVALR